jgi:tetratricopeptide (TPR) repeat protein
MKRIIKQLFEGSGGEPPAKAEEAKRHLAAMEQRLKETSTGSPEVPLLLNRAGDLAASAGEGEQALKYYGQSIDAYMALRQFDASTAVCRKVLRLVPDVVRARCTLAWLCLGKGHLDQARQHIDEYVSAARRAGREGMASQQLRLMAQYAGDPDFRAHLTRYLRKLGDADGAKVLEAWSEALPRPEEIGWDPVVFAALLTPYELRAARKQGLVLPEASAQDDDELPLYWPE